MTPIPSPVNVLTAIVLCLLPGLSQASDSVESSFGQTFADDLRATRECWREVPGRHLSALGIFAGGQLAAYLSTTPWSEPTRRIGVTTGVAGALSGGYLGGRMPRRDLPSIVIGGGATLGLTLFTSSRVGARYVPHMRELQLMPHRAAQRRGSRVGLVAGSVLYGLGWMAGSADRDQALEVQLVDAAKTFELSLE